MRREAEFFGDVELVLVQVSRKLLEAKQVEEALDAAGFDYGVEPDRYTGRFLLVIPVERIGAFFYVTPADAAGARELLASKGFVIVDAEDPAE